MHPIIRNALIGGGSGGSGAPAFSPIDLFQFSEQGVWYDPSDFSTMFQGAAGAIPLTAAGQPVGLILDKSKALALGSELVVNGTFGSNTSGWAGNSANATLTWQSGGTALFANTADWAYVRTSPEFSPPAGWYKAAFDVISLSAPLHMGLGPSGNMVTSTGSKTHYAYHAGGSLDFQVRPQGVGLFTVVLDNVSIKSIAGNHALQGTASFRPLLASTGVAKWINYDAVDDALVATFQSSLGSACTVARAVVGGAPVILTGQTIGTTFSDSTDNAGLVIIDRALTGQETTDLTAWLTDKGATS